MTTLYNVHIYREMRLFFPAIAAATPEEAAQFAAEKRSADAERVEDCEGETLTALIDVIGDEEYAHSQIVNFDPLRDAAPALLEALELAIRAMNATPSFKTGIPDPDHPRRELSSYQLLPQLGAVARQARGIKQGEGV